ncbi:hypothetical protein EDC04DRAFT_3093296, partial [Pisolithus marmoratus]
MGDKQLTVVTERNVELIDGIFGARIPIVLLMKSGRGEMEDWWDATGTNLERGWVGPAMSVLPGCSEWGSRRSRGRRDYRTPESTVSLIIDTTHEYTVVKLLPARLRISLEIDAAAQKLLKRNSLPQGNAFGRASIYAPDSGSSQDRTCKGESSVGHGFYSVDPQQADAWARQYTQVCVAYQEDNKKTEIHVVTRGRLGTPWSQYRQKGGTVLDFLTFHVSLLLMGRSRQPRLISSLARRKVWYIDAKSSNPKDNQLVNRVITPVRHSCRLQWLLRDLRGYSKEWVARSGMDIQHAWIYSNRCPRRARVGYYPAASWSLRSRAVSRSDMLREGKRRTSFDEFVT